MKYATALAPLHGIEDVGRRVECRYRVESGIFEPPSYLMKTLLSIAGFSDQGPSDKVAWSVFARLKGYEFKVRDWKRSTWTIECSAPLELAGAVAMELKRRLQQGAAVLDGILRDDCKKLVLRLGTKDP